MVLRWIGWSHSSLRRSLAALLLIAVVIVSLSALFTLQSLRFRNAAANPNEPLGFDFEEVVESPPDWIPPEMEPTEGPLPLGAHTVNPDGLLVVNPDAPHPIFQLMRDAEAEWEAKYARASKTLDEAVTEYTRRYHRPPPRGFDKWWEFAVKHNVQLPDEFDEIFEDIEPFWGIDPKELARSQQELEKSERVATYEKTDEHPELQVVSSTLPPDKWGRIEDVMRLIRDLEQDLPPLRFSLSQFDNPLMVANWLVKTTAREAAANGTTFTSADLPAITEGGWIQACPPDSPARLNPPGSLFPPAVPSPPPSYPKTFIASHRKTMDPCLHPWLFTTHGQFISSPYGPLPTLQKTLVPRFSLCSTVLHEDIRPPVPYEWNYESDHEDGAFKEDLPWAQKTEERLGWRGTTTGTHAYPNLLWKHAHRQRLVTLTNALEGTVSVLGMPEDEEEVPVGDPETIQLAQVNPTWMDVAFTGKPVQCNKNEGLCDEMSRLWEFHGKQGKGEEGQYKFIFDIDGNGWSGRFKRLITSNALIFKATIYPEWFTSRIAPWVHYVPIQISYSDLYDAVAFFRAHDELAAKIANAGREWSRQFWRREDMTAYFYRLLLEYARVSSLDRESMNYVG